MREERSHKSSKSAQDWRTWAIVVLCVIVLILLLVLCCLPTNQPEETLPSTDIADKPEATDASGQNIEQQDPAGNVLITGIWMIECSAGSTEVTTNLQNPSENAGQYYLVFEIRLPDDSAKGYEILYCSEPVAPGDCITNITFSHALEKDVYDAILHVQPLRMDEGNTPTNNVDLDILLMVE